MKDWDVKPARDHGLSFLERLRSPFREAGLIDAACAISWASICRLYLRSIHKLKIEGIENLPQKRSFVLVANHSSHFDAPILSACLPVSYLASTYAIAAEDTFFSKPARSVFSAAFINAISLSRSKRRRAIATIEGLRERLESDEIVAIIFPEGTRSRSGEMGKFKMGIGWLVAGTSIAVVPCYIDGAYRALAPGKKLPSRESVTLRIGEPVLFSQTDSGEEGVREISTVLQAAVNKLRAANQCVFTEES